MIAGTRRLLFAAVWQPLHAYVGRTMLTVVAIALGVALGLAIHLMNRATIAESARAARALFGTADLVVQGTALGFDEGLYPIIARTEGVAVASPILEVRAQPLERRERLTLLGMDMLRSLATQPSTSSVKRSREDLNVFGDDALLLTAPAAEALELQVGDTVDFQVGMEPVAFKIVAIVPGDTAVGYVDIAAAQWRLRQLGRLTRIDVRVASGAELQDVAARIEKLIPAGVAVTTPTDAIRQSRQLSRAFRINLTALGLVALFTGAFLIFGTQSLAVMRRRRELALLHALGTTRRQQIALVMITGVMLGIIGALLGVALGVLLAHTAMQSLFGAPGAFGVAPTIRIGWMEVLGFTLLGVGVSAVGSWIPALNAARIPTALALKAGNMELVQPKGHALLSALLCAVAIPLVFAPPIFELPLLGYVAIALILLAAVIYVPHVMRHVLTLAPRGRSAAYKTALAQLRGAAHTATQSVASILVSVSLMVAMAIMVTSLRGSFADSLARQLPGDIQVQAGFGGSGGSSYLDATTVSALAGIDEVTRVEPLRAVPIALRKDRDPALLVARSIDLENPARTLTLEAQAKQPARPGTTPAWISVALADRYGLGPDDEARIPLFDREVVVSIRGITSDYLTQASGVLLLDYAHYRELSGDSRVNSVLLWTNEGASHDDVLTRIRALFTGKVQPDTTLPGEVRERSLQGFDTVFAITYLLLAVAILIGLFGISVNASAQVLARRAEFGLLRHLGFTRGQIGAVLTIEGLCLGALGMLCGLLLGAVISGILIHVIGRQSFHWVMQLHLPFSTLALLTALVPVAAALTTLWSARSAMGDDMVRAVKEDW